ncbi:M23 family metallopeptidase [Evansella tamaricis]|uniref:M23 family metallopeptidase n=1 Tax=Evansella tamaricis TaxID=2069301 RepID=A0ABS6JAM6_9BACI|nr:M23 family metallopeptidase [Evansella tamaricis]MBU9710591.1 M23 family metallopeptidase [Evansella tamaricis]
MSNHDEKFAPKKEPVQEKLKRLMRKRWAAPALYLGLAAVVLTTFIWIAGLGDEVSDERDSEFDIEYSGDLDQPLDQDGEDAVPVTAANEVFQLPVVDENAVTVVGTFFDFESSSEDQVNSLIQYNNYYYQNTGIDISSEDGESFDVVAAMSGTVIKAEEDALFGQVVHIEHDNDVVTIYQALDGVKVEAGQTVTQGDVIGKAGRNLFNTEAGIHLHFEIRKEGVPVNPTEFMDQPMTALPQMDPDKVAESRGAEEVPEDVPDDVEREES